METNPNAQQQISAQINAVFICNGVLFKQEKELEYSGLTDNCPNLEATRMPSCG